MIKIEKIEAFNFEGAIRGLRNPMNSWDKSDSIFVVTGANGNPEIQARIGENDLDLMRRLYKAGHPHRKYLRQIMVSMDITAPLYWWKEFDTYKVGVTRNSCSTMHKIHSKEFTLDDFSHEHLFGDFAPIQRLDSDDPNYYTVMFTENTINIKSDTMMMCLIELLNFYREKYIETKDKTYWWQMIQLLPSSYNQKATITCNYENIVNMLQYRSDHKLDEWRTFCETMIDELPYLKEIINGNYE